MIHLDRDQHQTLAQALDEIATTGAPIQTLERKWLLFRQDISTATGIPARRIKELADGKRPTKTERAALQLAAIKRELNL